MATYHFQLLRGTTAKVNSYTGYEGELVFDKTKKSLFIHDGSTTGGIPVANISHIPTKVSQLINDANYASAAEGGSAANAAIKDAVGNVINTYYAPISSPSFTGTPTVPTISNLGNQTSTQIVNAKFLATCNYVVRTYGNQTINGSKTFTETINGTALRAYWDDVAENYLADAEYQPGTLVAFGGEKEITIATTEVNAVISTNPALLINGKQQGTPIALVGRVPVRVIGKVAKFDKLVLDKNNPGTAKVDNEATQPIARALESNEDESIKLVLCATKFSL